MILQPTNGGRFVSAKRLPSGYQQVAHISDVQRRSFINTGLAINPDTGILVRAIFSYDVYVAAVRSSGVDDRFYAPFRENGLFAYGYKTNMYTQTPVIHGAIQEVELNYKNSHLVKVDGITVGTIDGTLSCPFPLYLFAANVSNNPNPYSTTTASPICYFERTDGQSVTQQFVPCYQIPTGIIGMYDKRGTICSLTNSPFYINSGDGTFEKGNNIY